MDAMVVESWKRNAVTGQFFVLDWHVFEGVHYVNISSIIFLFDLDNSLTWNV